MNRRWFFTLAALGMLAVLVAGVYLVMGMGKAGTEKKAPKITLVTPAAPPPPPPPPPPKFEKKPDPPKEQKEVKLDQPERKQEAPPPSQDLKMEGAAGNGASAFGAGKVTSDDISKIGAGRASGTGTGGGGERPAMFDPYANYMNLAKGELQRFLNKNANVRRRRYALDVHLWVNGSGAVTRFELVGSSGDADTDEAVSQALASLPALSQSLPNNMPQPLRLRISAGS